MNENLVGKPLEELQDLLHALGEPAYRGRQLYRNLYRRHAFALEQMTDLSRSLREALGARFSIRLPALERGDRSLDGSEKFLFRLEDGLPIESVFIPDEDRTTLCLSTQAGCAMGCQFCATARLGLARQLTPGEILGQYYAIAAGKNLQGQPVNLVFMGMGEPLLNFEAVMTAFRIFADPEGAALSRRKITLSTCGLPEGIRRLGLEPVRPRLAISLNATTDEIRSRLMPVNRQHPLAELLSACASFPLIRGERITIEYVLIRDVNDAAADARRLVRLLRPLRCKLNLIPYNEIPGVPLRAPIEDQVAVFQSILQEAHYTAIVRKSRGADIRAACGQLAAGCPTDGGGAPAG